VFPRWGWGASVAQLAEQLICNQQVVGSSPSASLLKGTVDRVVAPEVEMTAVETIRLQGEEL
jgi:hypothetical protein